MKHECNGKAGDGESGKSAGAAAPVNPPPKTARDSAVPDLLRLAAEESTRGHHDMAARYYQDVLDLDIDNEAGMAGLGAELVVLERYDEAYACFHKVLERNPRSAAALVGIGDLCMALVEYERAASAYARAAKADPSSASPHVGIGEALRKLGEYGRAVKAYAAALQHDADNIAALVGLGACLLETDAACEALLCYKRVDELRPDMRNSTRYNMGKCFQALHDHGEAIVCFEAALVDDKDDMESAIEIGCTLADMGRTDAAIRQLDEVIDDAGDTDDAVLALEHKARILNDLGKDSDASEVCDEIVDLDPGNTDALLRKGRILAKSNRRLAALSCFSAARHCDPYDKEAKRDAAAVSLALKRDGKLPWMWDKRMRGGKAGRGGIRGGIDEWMGNVRRRQQGRAHAPKREIAGGGGGGNGGGNGGGRRCGTSAANNG